MLTRMTNKQLRDQYLMEHKATLAAEVLARSTGEMIQTRRSSDFLMRQAQWFEAEMMLEQAGITSERHRLSKVA